MFTPTLSAMLIICPLVFLAGFVDSVAGGGGLISIPAYLLAGLPIHMAYGTNKLSSCCGTAISVIKYGRSGYVQWKTALTAGAGALLGSWMGARLTVYLSEHMLHYCLLVILPLVAMFLLMNRNFGKESKPCCLSATRVRGTALAIGLAIGCYDGFFGPGTGTFLVVAFTILLGQNLTVATGNTKVVNFCSNVAAVITFIYHGKVLWAVGIPAALCNIAGNWLGSHMAVKKGATFIRPLVLFSVAMLFVNLIGDLF